MLTQLCIFVLAFYLYRPVPACNVEAPLPSVSPGLGPQVARYRCNSLRPAEGVTYLEVTNFVHGYITDKKHLGLNSVQSCSDYNNIDQKSCPRESICSKQPPCRRIVMCKEPSTDLELCLSEMKRSNRRYQNMTDQCTRTHRLFLKKDNPKECLCVCEEGPTPYSDIYISLRTAKANMSDNRVVTGVRFVKRNKIIHFQIQDAKLLPKGHVDNTTMRWVPVEDFTTQDDGVYEGVDYHRLTWEHRGLNLNDVIVEKSNLVTGLGFRRIGPQHRLQLEVLTTPFDYFKGTLMNPEKSSRYRVANVNSTDAIELKLTKPNVPTREGVEAFHFTSDKYVQFTHSDLEKDAAQTTVPFFDAQPLVFQGVLSGVGVVHKAAVESGGFVTPRIFPFTMTGSLYELHKEDLKGIL